MQEQVDGWKSTPQGLYRSFLFKDFSQAWAFMSQVALLAEGMQHHPNWTNSYSKVEITLSTHEENNSITVKDILLANEINLLLQPQFK
jgi:4a-hydroxytetrahydrobiopterin dehydratase